MGQPNRGPATDSDSDSLATAPSPTTPDPAALGFRDLRGSSGTIVGSVFGLGNGVDDHSTRDVRRRDADQRMPVSTGPGLKIKRRKSEHFVGVVNSSRRSTNQDAPTLAQGVINAIDLKPDNRLSR